VGTTGAFPADALAEAPFTANSHFSSASSYSLTFRVARLLRDGIRGKRLGDGQRTESLPSTSAARLPPRLFFA
jgi:hypothetical protein